MKKYITAYIILAALLRIYACAISEEAQEIISGLSFESNARSTNYE